MENTEGINFLYVLFFGTLAMFMLAFTLISFVLVHQRRVIRHQRAMQDKDEQMQIELLRATIQSQEDEQRRIAADLHDDVGILLVALKLKVMQVGGLIQENDIDTALADEVVAEMITVVDRVRDISHQMLPPDLEKHGLAQTLERVCNKIKGQRFTVKFGVSPDYVPVDPAIELALYRVTMELLNNVIKHSSATIAEVQLKQKDGELKLVISDNGKGFDVNKMHEQAGLGLKNIQGRLKAINAEFIFNSSTAGTIVTIRVKDI
jgi:signal transduction histidine kinase